MKKNIFREVLIAHLIFDAITIPLICIIVSSAKAEAVEYRQMVEQPARPYISELEYDEDGFIICPDENFGPV